MIIEIVNHGPLIVSTNYWGSEMDRAGKLYASVNAGAVRLLLPRAMWSVIGEWRSAKYVICSRGPWPAHGVQEAVELLFEDGTDSPYVLTLTAESFDMLPGEPEPGREWVLSAWVLKDERPHKTYERPMRWRRSASIPDLRPWSDDVS